MYVGETKPSVAFFGFSSFSEGEEQELVARYGWCSCLHRNKAFLPAGRRAGDAALCLQGRSRPLNHPLTGWPRGAAALALP